MTGNTTDPDTFGSNASQGLDRILQAIVIDNDNQFPNYRIVLLDSI